MKSQYGLNTVVSIHCFSNGNGRHSRLIADIISEKIFGGEVFTWAGNNLLPAGEFRAKYLSALRATDKGSYEALISFLERNCLTKGNSTAMYNLRVTIP